MAELEGLGDPRELPEGERPSDEPGRQRDRGAAVLAGHGEDEVGFPQRRIGRLPGAEEARVDARLLKQVGHRDVDRLADEGPGAHARDLDLRGVNEAGAQEALGRGRPADVAGAHRDDVISLAHVCLP